MKKKNLEMIIQLDTSPLLSGHTVRGIGFYTRLLAQYLGLEPEVHLYSKAEKQTKPSLVHYPYFDLFFPTLPIKPWVKTVVTIHDVIPLVFPAEYRPGKKGTLSLQRQRLALRFASAIITDSHCSKKDIHTYLHVPLEKISVIPLAGQPELTTATDSSIKQTKKRFGIKKRYVLYIGDINYNKNLPQLIKMLKYIPGTLDLVCVGKAMQASDLPEWKAIQIQAALSNVEPRVHFLSNVLSDDFTSLSSLYTGAECYIQPSLYEGFGLPVLEAMQCSTPVVAANTSSLPEVVGSAGLLVEPQAEALAAGVLQIHSLSKTARQKMIAAGQNQAKLFTWKKTAQATIQIYKKVLGV